MIGGIVELKKLATGRRHRLLVAVGALRGDVSGLTTGVALRAASAWTSHLCSLSQDLELGQLTVRP